MKPGGGKQKGAQFERDICRSLSLWISGNKNPNLLWRSAMSGGRSTLMRRAGNKNDEQAGDISAVGEEGHLLVKKFYLECKHYADLGIDNFMLSRPSKLGKFWEIALKDARSVGKVPLLIAKQNRYPEIVVSTTEVFKHLFVKGRLRFVKIQTGLAGAEIIVILLDDLISNFTLNTTTNMIINGEVPLRRSEDGN